MKKMEFSIHCRTVILSLFLLYAATGILSGQHINYRFPREPLPERMATLAKLTGEMITFNAAATQNVMMQPVDARDFSVKQVLDSSLRDTDYTYRQNGNIITIYKKETTAPASDKQGKQENGSLRGRIVEAETSEPLPGATVKILGTRLVAMTDMDGYYNFPKVPAGKQTIEISFISYMTEKADARIQSGRTANYDIKMSADSKQLNEVVVSGIARTRSSVPHATERLVVQEIKGLSVVASGISSEQISKSADRNAAQAVQRVSGVSIVDDKFVIVRGLNPRYNLTILNDNVAPGTETNSRSFALDMIPSRIIDKILVQKSPSPDNQADATGGVIKIYTKDAKAVKHFDIDIQLGWREGTTFNNDFLTYNGGKYDFLGIDDGTRALPKELPGYGSLIKAQFTPSRYAEIMNPTLTYKSMKALPNMQMTANYYDAWNVFGKTLSSLTSFSYKNEYQQKRVERQEAVIEGAYDKDKTGNDNQNTQTAQMNLLQNFTYTLKPGHALKFNNFFLQQGSDITSVNDRWNTIYYKYWGLDGFAERWDNNMIRMQRDVILSYKQRFLYAGNLVGNHDFGRDSRHHLRWNGGYTFSRQDIPDQRVILLDNQDYYNKITEKGDWTARGFPETANAEGNNDYALSKGIISRMWSRNSEGIYNGSLDYSFKIAPWLTAKAGTFHQWKKRTMYRRVYTVAEATIENVEDPWTRININTLDQDLAGFHASELSSLWNPTYLNDNYDGLAVSDRTKGSDSYVATEQNNAAYLMASFAPANGRIELSGGIRYEYNRQKIAAAIPPESGSQGLNMNRPILVDNPMKSWLPSASLTLRPLEWLVVRAAYGKTVNRTEFREVSPFEELDYENSGLIQGNIDLVSATAANYDARLEFYPRGDKAGDIISIGAFYKEIDKPIERINRTNRIQSYFNLISFRNAESATVKGLEIELRQSFDFIPLSFIRNLSVAGNASWINSIAKFDQSMGLNYTLKDRPLQGQASYLYNAGVYYENPRWGSKVGLIYNAISESIYAAGVGETYVTTGLGTISEWRGSLIELPRQLLDFSYTQRIGKGLQMKLTVQNLLNEVIRIAEDFNFNNTYDPEKETPVLLEETELSDGTIKRVYDYGDNIYSTFKPGRYVNFSVSYSF